MSTRAPIRDSSAWRVSDLGPKEDFCITLTADEIGALEDAARRTRAAGTETEQISRAAFDLSAIGPSLEAWRAEVFSGRGFVLLRGFPIERHPRADIEAMYFGLGTHFGDPVAQSNRGERLGRVFDVGGQDQRERAYRNARELSLHTDRCDVVGMLALQKAWRGGVSGYTSAHAIYNCMLAERADLLAPLFRGFRYHRFGEQVPGAPSVTREPVPVFSEAAGRLSIIFLRTYIEMGAKELGVPLTAQETEALDLLVETAHRPELKLTFTLEPGEAIFFNNCTMLHNRTAFQDPPDAADGDPRRRLLLRLWLNAAGDWPATRTHREYKGMHFDPARGSTYYDGDALDAPRARAATTYPD